MRNSVIFVLLWSLFKYGIFFSNLYFSVQSNPSPFGQSIREKGKNLVQLLSYFLKRAKLRYQWLEIHAIIVRIDLWINFHTWKDGEGVYFNDYFNWKNIGQFTKIVYESPAANIAAQLMGSKYRSVDFMSWGEILNISEAI